MYRLIRILVLMPLLLLPEIAFADARVNTNTPAVPQVSTPELLNAREKKIRCEKKWKKYRESQACFAPYRLADGGIKAEAFKHCTEMKQPDLCD